jgi:hypothetical protein
LDDPPKRRTRACRTRKFLELVMGVITQVRQIDADVWSAADDEPIPYVLTPAATILLAPTPRLAYDALAAALAASYDTPRGRAALSWGVAEPLTVTR